MFLFFHSKTEITVEFKPLVEPGVAYKLQWKNYAQDWLSAAGNEKKVTPGGNLTTKAIATNLEPGQTYCVRLVVIDSATGVEKGPPGKELVLDTEQVGCTPKTSKGCVIL
jgi:hypothetical protein